MASHRYYWHMATVVVAVLVQSDQNVSVHLTITVRKQQVCRDFLITL
jgi:hypothetical protein